MIEICSYQSFETISPSQLKAWITQDMKDLEKGSLRLLYATEAYGMGIDVPDVRHVVHIGPPSTMESMLHENNIKIQLFSY